MPIPRQKKNAKSAKPIPPAGCDASVAVLVLWMAIPLAMTIWFSFSRYNLLNPDLKGFAGFDNYKYLATIRRSDRRSAHARTDHLGLVITVVGGVLMAICSTVSSTARDRAAAGDRAVLRDADGQRADLEEHDPASGVRPDRTGHARIGMQPIDWFADYPLTAVIMIVAWQWLPFAFLILFTAIQSLDQEQKEAARIDGAGPFSMFFYITLPHLKRAIAVVVMMETIFLLSIFAEIYTTTGGGPGTATTNLSYLIYSLGLQQFDVGLASAGGILAVVLANIVSFFLVRMLAKNLKGEYEK
jgi:ABC-type sugar transport systems, permease components